MNILEMITVGQFVGALLVFWGGRRFYKTQVLNQNKSVMFTLFLFAVGIWLIVTRTVR